MRGTTHMLVLRTVTWLGGENEKEICLLIHVNPAKLLDINWVELVTVNASDVQQKVGSYANSENYLAA